MAPNGREHLTRPALLHPDQRPAPPSTQGFGASPRVYSPRSGQGLCSLKPGLSPDPASLSATGLHPGCFFQKATTRKSNPLLTPIQSASESQDPAPHILKATFTPTATTGSMQPQTPPWLGPVLSPQWSLVTLGAPARSWRPTCWAAPLGLQPAGGPSRPGGGTLSHPGRVIPGMPHSPCPVLPAPRPGSLVVKSQSPTSAPWVGGLTPRGLRGPH